MVRNIHMVFRPVTPVLVTSLAWFCSDMDLKYYVMICSCFPDLLDDSIFFACKSFHKYTYVALCVCMLSKNSPQTISFSVVRLLAAYKCKVGMYYRTILMSEIKNNNKR